MEIAELAAVLGLTVKEAEWNKAIELIEKIKKSGEEAGGAVKKAGEEAAEGWKKFQEMAELTERFLEEYVGFEGLKTIGEMTEKVISQTMNLQHLSERYGLAIKDLEGFDYMARLTGTTLQSITGAMQHMEFGLRATSKAAGFHGAAGALQQLGISAAAFKKASMPEQLSMLADKFEKMADPNQKIAMATQLGGRGLVALIPLLSKGREKMKELSDEAQELGYSLDPKKAEEYEESQAKLQLQWDGLKTRIVELLLPALQQLQHYLHEVMTYFRENPTALRVALAAIGSIAAFTSLAMTTLALRTLFVKGQFAGLLGTLGPLIAMVSALVEAVIWANDNLGRTPAVIIGVVGALVTLRTVLRSIKGEGLVGMLGGIGKSLFGAKGGILKTAAGLAGEGGVAAEGGALAEGGVAAAGGAAGVAAGTVLLPIALTAGGLYAAWRSLPTEHTETPYYASDADAEYMRKLSERGSGGDVHITAPVEIHTEASAEDIKEVLQDHLDDHIRRAHQDMKDE